MRSHEEHREEQAALERRCALLVSESEETRSGLENAERARKALEVELQEVSEKHGDLNNQVSFGQTQPQGDGVRPWSHGALLCGLKFQAALSGRRKLEVDLQTLQQEHEELQAELRGSTDRAKKNACEVRTRHLTADTLKLMSPMWNHLVNSAGASGGGAASGAGAHAPPGEGEERSGGPGEGHEQPAGRG